MSKTKGEAFKLTGMTRDCEYAFSEGYNAGYEAGKAAPSQEPISLADLAKPPNKVPADYFEAPSQEPSFTDELCKMINDADSALSKGDKNKALGIVRQLASMTGSYREFRERQAPSQEPVKATDHPDIVGGIVWSDLELRWINAKLSDAAAQIARLQNMLAMVAEDAYEKDEQIAKLEALLKCVETNLFKGMSKSIQKLQARTIREELTDLHQSIAPNEFHPDYDTQAVLVERIRELESELLGKTEELAQRCKPQAAPSQEPWIATKPANAEDQAVYDSIAANYHSDAAARIAEPANETIARMLIEEAELKEQIDKLEAELAGSKTLYEVIADKADKAIAELAEARKDAARVDWVAKAALARKVEIAKSLSGTGFEIGEWPSLRVTVRNGTIRDAIDAAMGTSK